MFNPNFKITTEILADLLKIETLRERIKNLPLTPVVLKTLRESARYQSVHYSTQIEGNRLSQKEVEDVLKNGASFAGRQRDEHEIKAYYNALEWMENNISQAISEGTIKTLHSIVEGGSKTHSTPYRDGQNVIKDSMTGAIVYMPPEAKDVPSLMVDLIDWLKSKQDNLPIPIIAAIIHYQFVTIHPYYDGNGRTARLLTTMILRQHDYGLKGIYSLEEYYARDLQRYCNAISIGDHHNYYFGRAEADITPWIEYFIGGMLDSFICVEKRMAEEEDRGANDKSVLLRSLSPKQRQVLSLFEDKAEITSKDVAKLFQFSERSARSLCLKLVKEGFLEIASKADKTRSYRLKKEFEDMWNGL